MTTIFMLHLLLRQHAGSNKLWMKSPKKFADAFSHNITCIRWTRLALYSPTVDVEPGTNHY